MTNGNCRQTFKPRVDVWESPTDFHVEAEVPGATPENTTVEMKDGELVFKVSIADRQPEAGKAIRTEYGVGDFERTIQFDSSKVSDEIDATLTNGVLHLRLKKSSPAIARKIEVRAN